MNERLLRAGAIVAMALMFVGAVLMADWPTGGTDQISSQEVGGVLFGEVGGSGYGLVVMLIGVLLLVAMLGGIFLAKEEKE
jgi:NADH:ubiquinone oxidoreductase subunit 6 (subunit J)